MITWVCALMAINGQVPPHAARLTASDPHVSIPRQSQPGVVPELVDPALLHMEQKTES